MQKLLVAFVLGVASLVGRAEAAVINYSTVGAGSYALFTGTVKESHLNFVGCPGGFFLCQSSINLEVGASGSARTHFVRLTEIGTNDGSLPSLSSSFDIGTVFNVGGQSVTIDQAVSFRQIANGQFLIEVSASETETIDLGDAGLLDITSHGFRSSVRPEHTGGTFTISSVFQLRPAALPPVPEPATWAMMIAGFALAGTALRRRPRCSGRLDRAGGRQERLRQRSAVRA